MLKNNVLWPASRRFKSRSEWEPIGFFSEALCNSTRFDIKLGFFSSSAINVLSDGFATFLYNGGTMRMIINDVLSNDDHKAIMAGETDVAIPFFDLQKLEEIKNVLSIRDQHFFECLAWLIKNDRLELKIVIPKDGDGIAHTKCGVFSDGMNRVAFEGSCNFSHTALIENLESITAFCDWDGQGDICKIDDFAEDFERTFSGNDDSVIYLNTEEVKAGITNNFTHKDIFELMRDEQNLISRRLIDNLPQNIVTILNKAKNKVETIIKQIEDRSNSGVIEPTPRFPYPSGPREYQKLAFENWKNNGQRGLFAMATGTGKTITSLNCLFEIYQRKGYYKAIILVPTITLVNQWEQECRKFQFANITKVYSKNPNWRDEVERIAFNEKFRTEKEPEVSYIIISTYASYSRDTVFRVLNGFDRKRLLMIADECHNMGSGSLVKRLKEIPYLRRIGLSATPERQFDDEGNAKLREFFGSEDHYTYEYSMEEAIQNGVLCKYMYYPHLVQLTTEEMDAYIELSEKISKYFNFDKERFEKVDDKLKMLLLARKRIIHKAVRKLDAFRNIVEKRFLEKGNLKYSLVYVPEGNSPDYIGGNDDFDRSEDIGEDNDAEHLINQFTQVVTEVDDHVTVRKFVSGQKDRDEILYDFAEGKLQVLTSMKCLDEGVDVPRSELAIFCSSTGNPRQFIQRRGRVLRTHPNKKIAELHDLVVIPELNPYSTSYRMEQSLVRGELQRVKNFADLSENPSFSEIELREVLDHYELNLSNNNITYDK